MSVTTGTTGPVVDAVVTLTRASGAYDIVSLAVPSHPAWDRARPGQLVVLPGRPDRGELLGSVLWLAGVSTEPLHGTTIDLVLPVGHELTAGREMRLLGPLGRGFALPLEPVPTVLVGYEGALAPLRWLVPLLRERGCPVHLVLSARDPDRHLDLGQLRRQADTVVLTSHRPEDLAEVLTDRLADRSVGAALVLGAGPLRLMREVARQSGAAGVVARVAAVDPSAPVVCGTGLCGQCDLVLDEGRRGARQGTSSPRLLRACLDGPVIPGEWLLDAAR